MNRVPLLAVAVSVLLVTPGMSQAATRAFGAVPVVSGLDFPAAFTLAPDGRIFYADTYTGEIHLYDPSTGSDTLFITLSGGVGGQQGVIGLTLAPTYPTQPFVYVYVTRTVSSVLQNQIVRVRDDGGVGVQPRVIYQSAAGTDHFGGRIEFGPDGMLYAVIGDANDSANSQDLTNNNGKILRMTPTGKVPPGNPFPGSLIWAYGIRNSIGFDFDPRTGFLWEDDNGPECNDEVNVIQKGRNYAWGPSETCSTPPPAPRNTNQDGPSPVLPVEYVATPTAPTGLHFCATCDLTGADGTFFYGTFNTLAVQQVTLTSDRRHVASDVVVYTHSSVVLAMDEGPDGGIYFSDDSGIWRLVPA